MQDIVHHGGDLKRDLNAANFTHSQGMNKCVHATA